MTRSRFVPVFRLNIAADQLRDSMRPEVLFIETFRVAFVMAACFIWMMVLSSLFPQLFAPLTPFSVWETKGGIADWIRAGLPVLIWGGSFTLVVSLLTRNSKAENRESLRYFLSGWYISILAGVTEEIRFRWLFFMLSTASIKMTNWVFGGFWQNILHPAILSWLRSHLWLPAYDLLFTGIIRWAHVYIGGPCFNLLTFGHLVEWLVNPNVWAVGSALLVVNAKFRDGHTYQGPIGVLNSWVLGFHFFWLTLTWGLPAAIVVHTLYDGLIFTIGALDRLSEHLRNSGIEEGERF